MLQQGVPADRILMVTYSRKAANALKDWLVSRMPDGRAKEVKAQTFHSYCCRLTGTYHTKLGFTSWPTVWGDDKDIKALVKEAIR